MDGPSGGTGIGLAPSAGAVAALEPPLAHFGHDACEAAARGTGAPS
jgi:hypothetical protein